MSHSTYQHYEVTASRNTGEWLDTPRHIGTVDAAEWCAMTDTDDRHYDTYEAPIYDDTGAETLDAETRAITVIWQ